MSTSAHITYYTVYDKCGKQIEEHRQNWMCKITIRKELEKYTPITDFTVILRHPNEDEVNHYSEPMKLSHYLAGHMVTWK
jgi:hypothetical protein